MLRKKLLARLGLLVAGFVTGAVVSISLLQSVLSDLNAMNAEATIMLDEVQTLSSQVASLEVLGADRAADGGAPDSVKSEAVSAINQTLERLGRHPIMQGPSGAAAECYRRVADGLASISAETVGHASPGGNPSRSLAAQVAELGRLAREHVGESHSALSRRLRTLVVGMTVAALIMVNISVVVLLRTAGMILRPVAELVEGSRELEQEHFGYRVPTDQGDEFAELAHAYNRLAGQLESNEQRKVDALQQLAVTLNHELNNVLSIIDLQLHLLDRKAGSDPSRATPLREIHENLERVARTIASLRNVRRIVLTDYMPGQKMLDLSRSVAVEDQ